MLIPIQSKYPSFQIRLEIEAAYPIQLGIAVFDPSKPHTFYFRRKVNFGKRKRRTIYINLPINSPNLALSIFEKGNKRQTAHSFELKEIEINPLEKKSAWASPEQHRFMDFAIPFAQKAGYLNTGYYPSKRDEFLIDYKARLLDTDGEELITPARIARSKPYIQISQAQFRQFSIPVRVAILAHEGCHYLQNTRSEKEADLCGIRYYLEAGFPKIEAVYAITQVFRYFDVPIEKAHLQRAKDIINFINQYSSTESLTDIESTKEISNRI
ncbi:MAG: hypothetical protein AAF806_23485 [Bacteroidota bacterium]